MSIKKIIFLSIFSCVACFCSDETDDVDLICTEVFVYGLNVTVKDASTNEIITENISAIAREDMYEEQLMLLPESETFVGLGERPGLYSLEVSAPDYQTSITEDIFLDFDGCHVVPEVLEILLQPN